MENTKAKVHYLKDYTPPGFIIDSVFLHFDLHEDKTLVKTILNMRRNPQAKDTKALLVLDGEDLVLKSIFLDGHALSSNQYKVDEHSLTINQVPDKFILETEVEIKPQENTRLSGLYKSRNNFCTQCEAEGFRRITYYLDRPDVLSHFTTSITADKTRYPFLLSNGNLIKRQRFRE